MYEQFSEVVMTIGSLTLASDVVPTAVAMSDYEASRQAPAKRICAALARVTASGHSLHNQVALHN